MDFHLLTDALQVLVFTKHRASFDDVTNTCRLHHGLSDANFVDIRETLYSCGNIHVLPKVVDPVVEPYGDGPAPVHTDLEPQWPRSSPVEAELR